MTFLYDMIWSIDTILTIVLKMYLIRIAYLFIVDKRWPRWIH
jgi:hypothetical protein